MARHVGRDSRGVRPGAPGFSPSDDRHDRLWHLFWRRAQHCATGGRRRTRIDRRCTGANEGNVDVAVEPGVADVWIADVTPSALANFEGELATAPATIVNAPLIKVKGQAHVDVGSNSETTLSFTQDDIDEGIVKRAGSSGLTQSIVSSLIADLKLNVNVLGLGLGLPGAVTAAVGATLAPVAAPLDGVIDTLLKTLGVSVGEADVRVHGVRCGAGILAG